MENDNDYAGYEEEQQKQNEEQEASNQNGFLESVSDKLVNAVKFVGDTSYKVIHAGVKFKEDHPKEYEVYKWLAITVIGGTATAVVKSYTKKVELNNRMQEEALKMAKRRDEEARALCKHWDPRAMSYACSSRPLTNDEIIEMDKAWKRGLSKAQYLASKGLEGHWN